MMQIPSLSFKVLALGQFTSQERETTPHEPMRVDPDHPDQIMEELGPSLSISLPPDLCQWDRLIFRFKRFGDFHPDRLLENHPSLKNLLEARRFIEEAKTRGIPEAEVYGRLKKWPDLPVEIRFEGTKPKEKVSSPLDHILKMVATSGEDSVSPPEGQPFATQINLLLQQVLRHLFSDPSFRTLESAYQGLHHLMRQRGVNGETSFEIVPVSLDTLEEALNHLMLLLVDDLPSLILIDLPFDSSPRSLELLEKVALFSETLLVPSLCWITPKFFYLDRWEDIGRLPFLPHYLEEPAFAKWRRLKGSSAAKWVTITCNRFLTRYPYGPDHQPKWVRFDELEKPWVSPVWGAGSLILQSFLKTGWPTGFTGWETIRLNDLALHTIEGGRSIPTETNFSDERIEQFIRGGITPLISPLNKDFAFIPKETTAGGASLSYQLFLSRTTQFLLWCKDHFEKDIAPDLLEENLKRSFFLFFEKSGRLRPRSVEVSAIRLKQEQPLRVKMLIEPSRQLLPSGDRVELELNW